MAYGDGREQRRQWDSEIEPLDEPSVTGRCPELGQWPPAKMIHRLRDPFTAHSLTVGEFLSPHVIFEKIVHAAPWIQSDGLRHRLRAGPWVVCSGSRQLARRSAVITVTSSLRGTAPRNSSSSATRCRAQHSVSSGRSALSA
jgi:hypothetical protein